MIDLSTPRIKNHTGSIRLQFQEHFGNLESRK